MASMKSDAARVRRYLKKFFKDNRDWLKRQELKALRAELVKEAKQLHDAGKLKQAAAKLKRAERIHAKLTGAPRRGKSSR